MVEINYISFCIRFVTIIQVFSKLSLNLLSKMFVLTEIIDFIILLFSKILCPSGKRFGYYTLWTPQLYSDNIAHTLATYL
jgi:hypothetical protein